MSKPVASGFQAAAAVAEDSAAGGASTATARRETGSARREKTLEEIQAEAKADSIRRGVYNPGAGEPNPLYEKDPKKRLAMADAIRAMTPGPLSNSTPYIRRCRDLDWGDDGDE